MLVLLEEELDALRLPRRRPRGCASITRPKSTRSPSTTMPRVGGRLASRRRASASARIAFDGMQPQLPHTPPGTVRARRPRSAGRAARRGSPRRSRPGPAPTTTRSYVRPCARPQTTSATGCSRSAFSSRRKRPASTPSTMRWSHDSVTVITRPGTTCPVAHDRHLADGADREDRRLRRIHDRGEVATTGNMPRFETVNVPPERSSAAKRAGPRPLDQRRAPARTSARERLAVAVAHDRHDEARRRSRSRGRRSPSSWRTMASPS